MKVTKSTPIDRLDKFVQLPDDHRAELATPGLSSPSGRKRACLCDKPTSSRGAMYSRECCKRNLINQGIGLI